MCSLVAVCVCVGVCFVCSPNMKKKLKKYTTLFYFSVIRRNTARLIVFTHVIIIAMICPLATSLTDLVFFIFIISLCVCVFLVNILLAPWSLAIFNFIVIHCQWGLAAEIPIAHCPGVRVMNLCVYVCVCTYYSTHLYVYDYFFFKSCLCSINLSSLLLKIIITQYML